MRAGEVGCGAGEGEREVERDENSESLLMSDLLPLPAPPRASYKSFSQGHCTDRGDATQMHAIINTIRRSMEAHWTTLKSTRREGQVLKVRCADDEDTERQACGVFVHRQLEN